MRKSALVIALIVSLFMNVACVIGTQNSGSGNTVTIALSTVTAQPISTTYVVLGTVNVRSCPSTSCGVVGYYYAGDRVEAECFRANSGEMWCSVPGGYVYAPCLGMEGVCR